MNLLKRVISEEGLVSAFVVGNYISTIKNADL
jgi:hypothetical protein